MKVCEKTIKIHKVCEIRGRSAKNYNLIDGLNPPFIFTKISKFTRFSRNFSDDVIVIIEGFMNEKGIFEAEKVQTKCPSKYEGEDMENYDTETHKKILEDM